MFVIVLNVLCFAIISWLYFEKNRLKNALNEAEKKLAKQELEKEHLLALEKEKRVSYEEKLAWVEGARQKLMESFQSLSYESLQKNHQSFLQLATQTMEKFQERAEGSLEKKNASLIALFDPLKESLHKLQVGVTELEKERKSDHEVLKGQLKHMVEAEKELKEETSKLTTALRAPATRGRWGEMQLRRVVEVCGMLSYCDFFEQKQQESLRPDMIIRLPGQRQVIVDAKTPFEAFFEAMNTTDVEKKKNYLAQHAKLVRQHVMALSKKAYWESFEQTPEFVILFLPSEPFLSAALEEDPSLVEVGVDHKVIVATPITLIGLLRAIAYGWKQEALSLHTKEIYELGKELHKRIYDMHQHMLRMGKSLSSSVDHYNKMCGSFESRVLPGARKFEQMGVTRQESIELSKMIEEQPKELFLSE